MNTPTKVVGFAVALAVVFGLALGAGSLFGTEPAEQEPVAHETMGDSDGDGGTHDTDTHDTGKPGIVAPVASTTNTLSPVANATSSPGRPGTRSATTGLAHSRPLPGATLAFTSPLALQIRSLSPRGTTTSRDPSPSRSATAAEPSHASS